MTAHSHTRLRGRWLLLAWVGWVTVALVVVVIFVTGEFLYVAELQTVCREAAEVCHRQGLLTPQDVRELREAGLSAGFYAAFDVAINAVFVSVWVAVGALIFWRRSDDRIALLVALFLVTYGPMSFGPYAPRFLAEEYPAFRLPVNCVELIGQMCLALFFCLFPSGRFVPRWTRWLALAFIASVVTLLLFPDAYLDWISRFNLPFSVALVPFFLGFVAAQVYRYRWMSGPAERQQIKWVVFGTTAALGDSSGW